MGNSSTNQEIKALLDSNKLQEARELLESVSSQEEGGNQKEYLIGLYHLRKEEYTLAIPHFQKIILESEDILTLKHSYRLLAYCYLKTEMYAESQNILDEFQQQFDTDSSIKNMTAYVYFSLNNINKALSLYRDVLKTDMNNKTALNGLCYCLVEHYDNPQEAIRLLKGKVGDDPRLLDTLGWAYYKLGDLKNAELYIRRAFEKMPANREIKQHITVIINS